MPGTPAFIMKMTPVTSITNQDAIILLQLLSLCCDFCILFDSSEPPHSIDYYRNETRKRNYTTINCVM